MAGDEWTAKLDSYLDGELPAAEMRALDAHVRGCLSCAAEVLNRVQVKRAVQTAGRRYVPSSALRARIENSLAAKKPLAFNWGWLTTATALVLIVVAAALVYQGRQGLRREQVFGELADLHVATLASGRPVDVVSTDRHTVKPWFQGKIPFTFNLPEMKDSDFVLVGGRVTYLRQTPGAELIYRVRQHQISVFIFQERAFEGGLNGSSPMMKRMSFNVETWTQDGLRYFVVGDASGPDIHRLSQLLRNAERS